MVKSIMGFGSVLESNDSCSTGDLFLSYAYRTTVNRLAFRGCNFDFTIKSVAESGMVILAILNPGPFRGE